MVSIAQDSTGYLWIATQDGLNKYNGQEFIIYDKQFEDVTLPKSSRLGKVYVDRENQLWIIPISGVPEIFDKKENKFVPLNRFKAASTLFQSDQGFFYIGTYGKGLYCIVPDKADTLNILRPEPIQIPVNQQRQRLDKGRKQHERSLYEPAP